MWSFYGLQKRLLLVTLTIYGHGCDTHGAGAGGGHFGLHSCPAGRRSILGVGSGMPPCPLHAVGSSPPSPPPPGPAPGKVATPVPLWNVCGGDGRLPLAPAPARLCPGPCSSGGCGKAGRGECLLATLLWGHASPKHVSLCRHTAFLAKHCSLVPLCCSPVIFKEKAALISSYYRSKDPLHEVGLDFLHH